MLECGSNHLATEQKETFRGIGMSINQKVGQQSLQNSPKKGNFSRLAYRYSKKLGHPFKIGPKIPDHFYFARVLDPFSKPSIRRFGIF